MLIFAILALHFGGSESASHLWAREDVLESILRKHVEQKYPQLYNIFFMGKENKRFLKKADSSPLFEVW